ncbi:hypothetical protein Hanom_Chr03g00230871 [Helianthus anomalus]
MNSIPRRHCIVYQEQACEKGRMVFFGKKKLIYLTNTHKAHTCYYHQAKTTKSESCN